MATDYNELEGKYGAVKMDLSEELSAFPYDGESDPQDNKYIEANSEVYNNIKAIDLSDESRQSVSNFSRDYEQFKRESNLENEDEKTANKLIANFRENWAASHNI